MGKKELLEKIADLEKKISKISFIAQGVVFYEDPMKEIRKILENKK